MARNLAQKLIENHLIDGSMNPGSPISIKIDQTLTQDATGTLVMLVLEALDVDRVKTEISVQYVDHNIFQADYKNPDDHLFLESACRRFGVWFSAPGNGVSHPLHMKYFGVPGKTLLGSDSHTPAGGAIGMLAIGAGGMDVAMSMAGEPFSLNMPEIWGVELTGELPDWVSAKDVILEMLRRHGVSKGRGRIIEYFGPGLRCLSAMDRHVIANMGTELGATSTVFPADEAVEDFMKSQGRIDQMVKLAADENADYDWHEQINLTDLVPLIAKPSSPGNVVPVEEVAGEDIYQAYVGSSANPGYRDFGIVAEIMRGRYVAPRVSLDVNPTSRDDLQDLVGAGLLTVLLQAGARIHQAGCNGCIGMGQAPASGRNSLRTVPRNFPERSGTPEDCVFLCSPETAAASALNGKITDPRDLGMPYPTIAVPQQPTINWRSFQKPLDDERTREVALEKGPNIDKLPEFDTLPDTLSLVVLLSVGDDISTDEILPAGSEVLPFRSNIPRISDFVFRPIDKSYAERAKKLRGKDGHAVVAGENYGQGSSREHAAVAPRYLGLRCVLAKSFARIHRQNLINYGILPLTFDENEEGRLSESDQIEFRGLRYAIEKEDRLAAKRGSGGEVKLRLDLSPRERKLLLAGGLINWWRNQHESPGQPKRASQ